MHVSSLLLMLLLEKTKLLLGNKYNMHEYITNDYYYETSLQVHMAIEYTSKTSNL